MFTRTTSSDNLPEPQDLLSLEKHLDKQHISAGNARTIGGVILITPELLAGDAGNCQDKEAS